MNGATETAPEQLLTEETSTWPMRDGGADITHYPVFPGVDLYINDIHGSGSLHGHPAAADVIELNFCAAGRYEQFYGETTRILLQDGDFSINCENPVLKSEHTCVFPTGKYQGVQLLIYPGEAEVWCRENLPAFPVAFHEIIESTLQNQWVRFGKASLQCEHIFRELYTVNAHSGLMWLRLKTLELILSLPGIGMEQQEYIPSDRVRLARHLRDHIISMDRKEFSLEKIAAEHKLSVSQMQRIFQSVFGQPMYRYLKQYRLEEAARLLQNSEMSVEEIALSVGYQTPAKFTEAFKASFGATPLSYRRGKR